MSAWRDAIAAALGGVAGIDATALPPSTVTPGAAWPQWASAVVDSYAGNRQTWYVIVVLPNADMADTVEAGDAFVQAIADALTAVGEVVAIDPATVNVTDAGAGDPMPALRFTFSTSGATP